MRVKQPLAALFLVATVAACGTGSSSAGGSASGDPAPADSASTDSSSSDSESLPKSFVADMSDGLGRIVSKGDDVKIGYVPGASGSPDLFSVSGTTRINGKDVEVYVGPIASLSFKAGASAEGGGHIDLVKSEDDRMQYTSMAYPLFYGTSESEGVAHLQLSKAERLKASNSLVFRYHLKGTFQFKAAYQPESLSEECIHEAGIAMGSNRKPMYNASLCKAKKTDVTGSFDIVSDFPETNAAP